MKKILFSLALVIFLLNSCSKSSSPPANGNNNGGNNNGGNNAGNNGGNASGVTVSSVTPVNPYPDDQITITGTGFNPDASKDTVEFGRLINGNFGAWHDGLSDEWASLCTVVSATATELVVQSMNPVHLDYSAFNTSDNSIAVVQVRTGGKKAVTPVIPFKRLLVLSSITNPDLFNDAIGRPGDSLEINGKGFAANGVSVSIDGAQLTDFKIDNTQSLGKIKLRLPKTFFGMENDESIMVEKNMTLSNPDGKTVQKTFHFLLSPFMQVYDMQPENNTYSLSGLNGSGGVVRINVSGRNLKSDATVIVGGVGVHSEGGLQVSGFPDNAVITLSPASLGLGNLQVTIMRGNTLYGACHFTVTQ